MTKARGGILPSTAIMLLVFVSQYSPGAATAASVDIESCRDIEMFAERAPGTPEADLQLKCMQLLLGLIQEEQRTSKSAGLDEVTAPGHYASVKIPAKAGDLIHLRFRGTAQLGSFDYSIETSTPDDVVPTKPATRRFEQLGTDLTNSRPYEISVEQTFCVLVDSEPAFHLTIGDNAAPKLRVIWGSLSGKVVEQKAACAR
jgi:hypothetical protein